MLEPKSRGRIIISSGILTTMFMGIAGFAWTEIKKIPVIEVKQAVLKDTQKTLKMKQETMSRQIDEIHWHLIRKKNGN